MVAHLLGRKGAARIALIPSEVLDALNAGRLPTVNLNEFLALDLPRLTRAVAQQIGLDPNAEALADTLAHFKRRGGLFQRIREIPVA